MKTWVLMYLLIWVVFFGMLVALFPVFSYNITVGIHGVIGVMIVIITFLIFRQTRVSQCPDRIKRITRSTFMFGVAAGVFGVALTVVPSSLLSGSVQDVVRFIHFSFSIVIITQASSSATAFDMWEEKEYLPASPAPPAAP